MQVTVAEMKRVRLPLVHQFQTSSHRKSYLEHILVRLTSSDGITSWGEIASPSGPYFSAETVDTCWLIAEEFILPGLLGLDWQTPDEAQRAWDRVRGNNFSKAGVDAAVWALYAADQGVSLAASLGGSATEVVAGVSLGIEPTVDELLVQVHAQVAAGYSRVKLKIAPGWDVDPVRAVREAFPELDLHVDANAAYNESPEHLVALRRLNEFGLKMIEQPFAAADLLAHARLQAQLSTPICLDESIESVADIDTAIALDAARIINIKVSRMGGLTEARAAHDMARAADVPVWCGGMHEFGVGRAANLAISSLPGFTLPSDVSASEKYYARDVTTVPIVAVAGRVAVPTAAGLGFDVDEQFVEAHTVRTATLR
jgi:O-succinylbenzoate synthase